MYWDQEKSLPRWALIRPLLPLIVEPKNYNSVLRERSRDQVCTYMYCVWRYRKQKDGEGKGRPAKLSPPIIPHAAAVSTKCDT